MTTSSSSAAFSASPIFCHWFINAYFVPVFYKIVLNKVNLKDLEAVDYELYNCLT